MTEEHQRDQADTFGPLYRYAEYHVGDSITYRDDCPPFALITGEIVWVVQALTLPDGSIMPAHYMVVAEPEYFPTPVYFSQVVEQ